MRTRAVSRSVARSIGVLATSAVLIGSFGFLFLAKAPVRGVTDLYWGMHLDGVMTLDDLFGLGHVAVYAALTMMLGFRTRSAGGWLKIFVVLASVGLGVEIMQGLGGSRSFGFEDLLANLIGICLGFFGLIVIGPSHKPRRRRR